MSKMPKLRFKEFSGEWKSCTLGNISSQISYGLTIRPDYDSVGIPLISARELKNGVVNYTDAPKISQKSYDELSSKAKAKKGDIFLTKTGTIGLSAYVNIDIDFPIAITQNIAVIRVDGEQYEHQFILQTFKTELFFKSAIAKVNQSTIMDLQLQDIRKLVINIPSKQEQHKIVSFLSAVDTKIDQLTRKKELFEQYKKGVMQKIFTQELRFKADDGSEFPEWEEKKLGEVLESIPTKKYQIKTSEIKDFGKYLVVDQGQDLIAGFSDEVEMLFTNHPVVVFGDHTTVLKYIDYEFIIGADGTKVLKCKKDHPKYVFYNLSFNNVQQEGYKRHFTMLSEIYLQIPSLAEQTKIANFLSAIDTKIDLVVKQLDVVKNFKKGLLQQMFV